MTPTLSLSLAVVGLVQLILAAGLCWRKRPPGFIALLRLLCVLLAALGEVALRSSGEWSSYTHLYLVCFSGCFLLGPMMLFYVRSVIGVKSTFASSALHIAPSIVVFATAMWLGGVGYESLAQTINTHSAGLDLTVLHWLTKLSLALYIVFLTRDIQVFNTALQFEYGNVNRLSMRWLLNIASLYLVVIVFVQSLAFGTSGGKVDVNVTLFAAVELVTTNLFILLTVLFGLFQLQLPHSIHYDPRDKVQRARGPTAFDHEQLQYVSGALNAQVTQGVFYSRTVCLTDVAKRASIEPALLLDYLLSVRRQTFHQFVQQIRVEYAKSLLIETDSSIRDIAMACGFDNSNRFKLAFLSIVRTRPQLYRKKNRLCR
ncbi:MAG: helix-turn-helix transcriptional regulator [Gammaproteobacteria bacterium]|nr:helix-turn-helix transcriptional regulator [Gammaproteobacteria bacterium]